MTLRAFALALLVCVTMLLTTGLAYAHKPSDSYLTLDVSGRSIDVRWDIALRDLDYNVGLDANGDGNLTWGEVKAKEGEIDALALSRLQAAADGSACTANGAAVRHEIVTHSDGSYVVLRFPLVCAGEPRVLDLDYGLFFDSDPQHRGLVHLDAAGSTSALTFSTDHRHEHVVLRAVDRLAQFRSIVGVGIHHIWEGYDHLLFLLALLLPSVLRRSPVSGTWEPAEKFRPVLWDVLRIVTAFTVAHSLTLSLAALDIVRLPSRITESAIAASVVVAALNNLVPLLREDRWLAAFALGLLHGFGFSATLIDLGLPRDALLLSLFGFNLGVEIGQLTVVAAFLPLAFLLRRTSTYRKAILRGGSAAIALLATVWFVERAFDVKLLHWPF